MPANPDFVTTVWHQRHTRITLIIIARGINHRLFRSVWLYAIHLSFAFELEINPSVIRLTPGPSNFHDQKSRLDSDRISSFNPINGHLAQHMYYKQVATRTQTHWDEMLVICGVEIHGETLSVFPLHIACIIRRTVATTFTELALIWGDVQQVRWVAIYQRIFEWGFLLMSFCLYSPYSWFYPLSPQ